MDDCYSRQPFDVVILSGGGSKAISELGVLHYYYEKGLLNDVVEYRGASAGSIISLLLNCGYAPMEVFQHIYVTKNLLEGFKSSADIYKNKGLIPIKEALRPVKELIEKKLGEVPTLLELRRSTGKKLIVSVINMTHVRQEYFTSDTKPDISSLKAVMASSNIPGIFQEFIYKGDTYLDGGLGDNFPAEGIDPSKRILGVIVTGKDSFSGPDLGMFNYISRGMMYPINTMTKLRGEIARSTYPNLVLIELEIDDVPIVEFSMSSERKMDIFMKGYRAATSESKRRYLMVKGWERMGFDILSQHHNVDRKSESPYGFRREMEDPPTEEECNAWGV